MPGNYGSNKKPKMTYQQYVKARSEHMKKQGTNLTGAQRMKQIANEWNSKGKGIALQGGGFMDILKVIPSLVGFGLDNQNNEMKMVGGGQKLNTLKKFALKYGVPLASAGALMALGGSKMRDVNFDNRNFLDFETVANPMMDEDKITGMGLKKKGKKQMGKGAKINKIGQIAKKFGIPLVVATGILASGLVAENELEIFVNEQFGNFAGQGLKQQGKGAKLDKFKKLAKKYAVPVSVIIGVLTAAKNLDMDFAKLVPSKLTGLGGKKMTKKQKQMQGEGFFSDIGDSISGFFSDPVEAITKTAGFTLGALPFIL